MTDIRDDILKSIAHRLVTAKIVATEEGVVTGSNDAQKEAERLGVKILQCLDDPSPVKKGDTILRLSGHPKQIVMAEDLLIGHLAKPSGIATAAGKFVERCGDRPKIVSGSWKKMPIELKGKIRNAVSAGGAAIRISETPFVYLDKNYIRMLGGITPSLLATRNMRGRKRVVQIRGFYRDIASEACEAAENGADIIFIDSGRIQDAKEVIDHLAEKELRWRVTLVFAGGIRLEDLEELVKLDLDFLDVGRAIVDAPLLDMRMVVEEA